MFEARRTAAATGEGVPLDLDELANRIDSARAPRGAPKRGHSAAFYLEVLKAERELLRQGYDHPAAELARRKRVPRNRVYQWLYRARKLEAEQKRGR
jgi:hypothetical protein